MTAVKICGIKNRDTLNAVISAGADYAGFVFYPKSPRHIDIQDTAALRTTLPASVKAVSVVVDPDDTLIDSITDAIGPDYIQLHGKETVERVIEIRKRIDNTHIIKAISILNADDIQTAQAYAPYVDMIMFDAKAPANAMLPGGNGVAFDWRLLEHYQSTVPWMLSGGLNPRNVADAIHISGTSIIDVSSGVESSPGVKDIRLIHELVNAAKK